MLVTSVSREFIGTSHFETCRLTVLLEPMAGGENRLRPS